MSSAFHRALRHGDHHTAAEWLVRHHATAVLALCEGIVRDETLAEDLCQDAFTRAFGGLGGYRRESEPRSWLLAIARNRCLDELRRQGRSLVDADEHIDQVPDERPLEAHLLGDRQAVQQALDGLEERDRAMVLLRFVHGLGYPELADAFGIKQGAARMRISRALARMRDLLQPEVRTVSFLESREVVLPSAAAPPPMPAAPASRAPSAKRLRHPKDSSSRVNYRRRSPPPPPPTLRTVLRVRLSPALAERLDALLPPR
jgi:RNA polymerase sigma-70 factor (ECF subfamily)